MHKEPDKPVFSLTEPITQLNMQRNLCSLMCYTVPIWTLFLWTVGN